MKSIKTLFEHKQIGIDDDTALSVQPEHLDGTAVKSVNVTLDSPNLILAIETESGVARITMVNGPEEIAEETSEGEPVGRWREYASVLDRPLVEVQSQLPWITCQNAEDLGVFALKCFIEFTDAGTAEQYLTELVLSWGGPFTQGQQS